MPAAVGKTDPVADIGQLEVPATTLTALYTAPLRAKRQLKSIVIANRTGGALTYRLSLAVQGEADNVKQYLCYDLSLPANESDIWEFGDTIPVRQTDVIRVYASGVGLTAQAFLE